MNYEPNTHQWDRGDLVIHDADAKTPKMIMVVVGRGKDGKLITKYLNRQVSKLLYENDIKYLHDPDRFGLLPKD